MKPLFFLCLYSILFTSQLRAEEEVLSFDEFYKEGMKTEQGIVPVYYDEQHIYVEIRQEYLGRGWLVSAQIDRGAELINRNLPSLGVFFLEKGENNTLCLKRKICPERITNEHSLLSGVLANSGLKPVYATYEIEAISADKQGYIIDITSFLKEGNDWFEIENDKLNGGDPSTTELIRVKSFGEGVQFTMRQQFEKSFSEGVAYASYSQISGQIPVEVSCVLRLLPAGDMKIRFANDKVGYETISYTDYSKNPYKAVKDSVILRWRLEVAEKDRTTYQTGRKVKPVKPIIFHIDSDCPRDYLKPIKEGILEWNKAFEQAGFIDALKVDMLPRKEAAAISSALVSFDLGTPGVRGEKTVDPETGEILYCRINIGHGFLGDWLTQYLFQCGANDPRILKNIESPEVAQNILKGLVAKEIGKMLGLTSNYAGSGAYSPDQLQDARWVARHGFSASITDNIFFHYMAKPTDKIVPEDLIVQVGEYDRWAIEWGYKEFPANKNLVESRRVLERLIQEKDPVFLYLGKKTEGNSGQELLSSRPWMGIKNAVDNLKVVYADLETACYGSSGVNDNGSTLKYYHRKGMELYMQYMHHTTAIIASQQQSEADRHAAFSFLGQSLFREAPIWLTTNFLTTNNIDQPVTWLPTKIKPLFEQLLSVNMMNNLTDADWKQANTFYNTEKFWQDIRNFVFGGFADEVSLSPYQMNIQHMFINTLLESIQKNNVRAGETDYALTVLRGLQILSSGIEQAATKSGDSATRDFYTVLQQKINIECKK